ncbi:hypothetical protein D3C71_2128650 [compost metagenome]
MPPMMVEPEREVPGIIASTWAQPTFSASRQPMSSTWCTRAVWVRRSAYRISKPPTISAVATLTGLKK